MNAFRLLAEWYIVAASASHGVSAAPLQRCGKHSGLQLHWQPADPAICQRPGPAAKIPAANTHTGQHAMQLQCAHGTSAVSRERTLLAASHPWASRCKGDRLSWTPPCLGAVRADSVFGLRRTHKSWQDFFLGSAVLGQYGHSVALEMAGRTALPLQQPVLCHVILLCLHVLAERV